MSPREWADIDRERRLKGQILDGTEGEILVSKEHIKDIIHSEHLSPSDLFGTEYMDKFLEAYQYARDTLAREKRADPPPPPPAAAPAEPAAEKKVEVEKELSPYLDPRVNPFIKLD